MSPVTADKSIKTSYLDWTIVVREQWNGITADCVAPDGQEYMTPFCFQSQEAALNYAKNCVDYFLRILDRQHALECNAFEAEVH